MSEEDSKPEIEILDGDFGLSPYGENLTKRLTVQSAEEILYRPFPVLDHGFVRLVDYMGSDLSVDEAARVSYGKGTRKVSETRGLIRYLMRHKHTTPSEMVEVKFHAKLPIFVARQWIRHRTASVNEMSARYSLMPAEFYTPEPEVIAEQSKSNNQGRGEVVSYEQAETIRKLLIEDALLNFEHYAFYLNEDSENPGKPLDEDRKMVSRELARLGLPVSTYTQWYWKTNLHNLFHFLKLRMDPHAQWEIVQYANSMAEITKAVAPVSYEAFEDYDLHSMSLSRLEIEVMKKINGGENPDLAAKEIIKNGRERNEFLEKLKKLMP